MPDPTIKWNWYGTWLIDWVTCDTGDFSDSAWSAFDIWKKAYLEARPDIPPEISDLELIENHYCKAMEPIFNSWFFAGYLILHWPANALRQAVWTIKRKFSCKK